MRFMMLMERAQQGEEAAIRELLEMYMPLILRESVVDGVYDEDLYQELCLVFLKCLRKFSI